MSETETTAPPTDATIDDDYDWVTECWPKGVESVKSLIAGNPNARVRLEDLRPKFESNYLGIERPEITTEALRTLVIRAGIQPVPDSPDEFFAEPRPGYDFREEKQAKREYLTAHFKTSISGDGSIRVRKIKTPRVAPADRALRVGGQDVTRLKTGFPSLDAATRGGILLRKLAIFGGAPGAGKTALLVRSAYRWVTEGVAVGILAADEDADGLLIRLGQLHGLSRDALENGDPTARAALAAWCKSVPLILVDGDEDDGTIEVISRELRAKAGKGPSALIVDSMQTARSEIDVSKGADLRAKINVTVQALKRAAKVDGHVVVASSELSKAAYRNADASANVNALSAFKESGDIEYGAALALVLTSRPGTSELVDASVVKNRLGPGKPAFMLRLEHDRADVHEATTRDVATTDPLYFVKGEIKAVVEKSCGLVMTKGQIHERVGGNRAKVFRAISELLDAHEIHHDRHGIRLLLPGDPGYENRNKS